MNEARQRGKEITELAGRCGLGLQGVRRNPDQSSPAQPGHDPSHNISMPGKTQIKSPDFLVRIHKQILDNLEEKIILAQNLTQLCHLENGEINP
jgi:hypothetical protein